MVDIELRVLGGYLVPPADGGKKLPLGDGVDVNDQPFLATFPYVPSLKNVIGGSPTEDRQEPLHPPTPGENPSDESRLAIVADQHAAPARRGDGRGHHHAAGRRRALGGGDEDPPRDGPSRSELARARIARDRRRRA